MKVFVIILVVCVIWVIAEERTFDFYEAAYPTIYAGNLYLFFLMIN